MSEKPDKKDFVGGVFLGFMFGLLTMGFIWFHSEFMVSPVQLGMESKENEEGVATRDYRTIRAISDLQKWIDSFGAVDDRRLQEESAA